MGVEDREYERLAEGPFAAEAGELCPENGRLMDVVRVKLQRSRRSGWYQLLDPRVSLGDMVVVEAERGTSLGQVTGEQCSLWFKEDSPPPRLLRVLNTDKDAAAERQTVREAELREVCGEMAAQQKLDLKVVDAEYVPWENRVIFFFVSEGRVDFRELVKELCRETRCRVEMRQIGPRDEARLLGGLGSCGREFCCTTFLPQFESVRIRMVKDQGLVLNPTKVSGGCGKLKCCLAYEVDVYKKLRAEAPPLGTRVKVPDGRIGLVQDVNVIGRKVAVVFEGMENAPAVFRTNELCDETGKFFGTPGEGDEGDGGGRELRPLPRAKPMVSLREESPEEDEVPEGDEGQKGEGAPPAQGPRGGGRRGHGGGDRPRGPRREGRPGQPSGGGQGANGRSGGQAPQGGRPQNNHPQNSRPHGGRGREQPKPREQPEAGREGAQKEGQGGHRRDGRGGHRRRRENDGKKQE